MPSLLQLRKQIAQIDDQIVMLLNRRLERAHQIGPIKAPRGEKIYNQARERKLLARLSKGGKGLLADKEMRSIYQRILIISRNHQARVFRQVRAGWADKKGL